LPSAFNFQFIANQVLFLYTPTLTSTNRKLKSKEALCGGHNSSAIHQHEGFPANLVLVMQATFLLPGSPAGGRYRLLKGYRVLYGAIHSREKRLVADTTETDKRARLETSKARAAPFKGEFADYRTCGRAEISLGPQTTSFAF